VITKNIVQASINGRAGETFAYEDSSVWRFSSGDCVDHSTTTEALMCTVFSQPFGQTLLDSKRAALKRYEWRIDNAARRFTHLMRR